MRKSNLDPSRDRISKKAQANIDKALVDYNLGMQTSDSNVSIYLYDYEKMAIDQSNPIVLDIKLYGFCFLSVASVHELSESVFVRIFRASRSLFIIEEISFLEKHSSVTMSLFNKHGLSSTDPKVISILRENSSMMADKISLERFSCGPYGLKKFFLDANYEHISKNVFDKRLMDLSKSLFTPFKDIPSILEEWYKGSNLEGTIIE